MLFQEIPPFFKPGTPPLARSTVLAQTEIRKMHVPDKLLAQKELGPNPIPHERFQVHFSLYPFKNNKQNKKIVSAESESKLSLLTSDDSGDDEDNLISKPEGEASWPGHGGHNLKDALCWPGKDYQRLKVSYFMVLMIFSNFSLSPTEVHQEACQWATWDRQELFFAISCLYCIYLISGTCFNTLI